MASVKTGKAMLAKPTIIATARMLAAAEFSEGDKERYVKICEEYRHEHKLEAGFDFFEYAAGLPPDLDTWKSFIISIRVLGRYSTFSLSTEDKAAEQKRLNEIMLRASLMGTVVNRIVCYNIFPTVMYQSGMNFEKCEKRCVEVIERIAREERRTKVAEDQTTMVVALAAAKASGIPNSRIASVYTTPETVTVTLPTA